MFQQKPKPGAGDWEGRLSEELQNLPRMDAPWYFEAELQRRMRFANQKRSALPGRAQSIALAVLAVSLLGTAAFFIDLLPIPRYGFEVDRVPEKVIPVQPLNADSNGALRKADPAGEKPSLRKDAAVQTHEAGAPVSDSSSGRRPAQGAGEPPHITEPGVVTTSVIDSTRVIAPRIANVQAKSGSTQQRKDTSAIHRDSSGGSVRIVITH